MATYAIGDIQGCYDQLQALLEKVAFDPADDRLWLTGDLVNRGPRSLEVLRFVRNLGERAVTVLGNHDLHLLAVWQHRDRLKRSDSLEPVLAAPDGDELLHWLRRQPLMHDDPALGFAMVHAGLSPQWDLPTAMACAEEVNAVLRGDRFTDFLAHMYGNRPDRWSPTLTGWDRLRYAVNCFTRLRYCSADGRLEFRQKDAPGSQPAGYLPWFEVPGRRHAGREIIFGHWSTLGLYRGHGVRALDTGCLWGGALTALRLEDGAVLQIPCPRIRRPR